MAQAKLSEYRAKYIINQALGNPYLGEMFDVLRHAPFRTTTTRTTYVVKVDQAVKKRNTAGLVALDVAPDTVDLKIQDFYDQGYRWLLVEPFVPHSNEQERFIALERREAGINVSYSKTGGVDVENSPYDLQTVMLMQPYDVSTIPPDFLPTTILEKLLDSFDANHFTYLEINPFIVREGEMILLDAALEVDTAAEFFVNNAWTKKDIRMPKNQVSEAERAIDRLASSSPASFTFKSLNPDGSLFLLLSGGGASVVVTDEISSRGYYKQMANYGEYSGNPTEEETYIYTKQLIAYLLASKASRKVLLIAGGVANFTDVGKTFKGVIRALDDNKAALSGQRVSVFVRRGGPHEKVGLEQMRKFLERAGLAGEVYGSTLSLSDIVYKATKGLDK